MTPESNTAGGIYLGAAAKESGNHLVSATVFAKIAPSRRKTIISEGGVISIHEALSTVWEEVEVLPVVSVPLSDAFGLVVCEDVKSDQDIPPFDKSAMDGFAVRSQDIREVPALLNLLPQTIFAGEASGVEVGKEEAVRIMTGAPVPSGADAVVMVEHTSPKGECIEVLREVSPGQNICRKGEDLRSGSVAISGGTLITPQSAGLLASVGAISVRVHRRPEVALISTGNEIVEPEVVPPTGKIRNSNSSILLSELSRLCLPARYLGIASDEPSVLSRLIRKGLQKDLLLITGGVSVGEKDFVPEVLRDLGAKIYFHGVAMKPGKPLLFARLGKTFILGLPGNPVSVLCTFNLFVRVALQKMIGLSRPAFPVVSAVLSGAFSKRGDRYSFHPARAWVEDGVWRAESVNWHGSADIAGASRANSLICIPPDTGPLEAGGKVSIFLLGADFTMSGFPPELPR